MEKVVMYDGRLYKVIFYDVNGWVLTVNDEIGWNIERGADTLDGVPEYIYEKYIGKIGWWFPEGIIEQDFKPFSVENV